MQKPKNRLAPTPTPGLNTATIRGRIFDENRQPIVGAKIFIPRSPRQSSKTPRWAGEETITERATTDTDGRFSANLTEDDRKAVTGGFIRPPSLPLLAHAQGRGFEWVNLPVGKELHGAEDLEFVLRPERVIHGRLIDSEGQPISGANVAVRCVIQVERQRKTRFVPASLEARGQHRTLE